MYASQQAPHDLREGKGREGKGREGKGREGKGREGKGREGKGREGRLILQGGREAGWLANIAVLLHHYYPTLNHIIIRGKGLAVVDKCV